MDYDHDITVLQSELMELRGANQSLYERYREAADLAAVRGVELREAKAILRDIAITGPAMSDGMCAWCLAGLTSGDEHSETCLWWRSRLFLGEEVVR